MDWEQQQRAITLLASAAICQPAIRAKAMTSGCSSRGTVANADSITRVPIHKSPAPMALACLFMITRPFVVRIYLVDPIADLQAPCPAGSLAG